MYIGKGYIALIHQYQNNGYNIVMDVYSGAVHVVDELCYDVIAKLSEENEAHTAMTLKEPCVLKGLKKELGQKYEESEIEDALSDVIELTEAGRLFVEDAYECMIEEVKKRKTVVKALCLHIAHDCNLACKYCFAEEGEYHGRRALMSFEVGKKALDFLIANSGNRHNLEVDFFGGEPLMNWQVVKDLVAYGREQEKIHDKHFRFTITTNGVLLNDEVQEFVNKEMDNVVLSLDGRKDVNDRMRPFRNGKGSYDLIVPKFQKLAKIMIEREKEGKGFNFFHFMIDLDGGPCVAKRLSGCGSGTEYLAVTPWGDLYPCHQFVGQEEFLMGNVDEGIVRPEIADDFRSCNVYSKDKCRDCFAKFYCSGGCMANSYNFHGTIHDTYDIGCEMQRKRVECAIMMKAALAEE